MAIRKLRTAETASTAASSEAYAVETIADGPLPAGIIEVTGGPGTAPAAEATVTAVAKATPRSMAPLPSTSGIEGDWDQSDIKFPTLKIVQGSGQLSQQWNQGTIILGDEELLPPPDMKNPKPEHVFRFVPVTLTKQFRENLSQEEAQSGAIPRVVNTLAEVEAFGGSTQWVNNEKPSWSPSARILLLVERPENLPGSGSDHPGFVLDFAGKLYAPAIYYAAGTSWTNFAKPLFNAALTTLMVPERDEQGNVVKTPSGAVRRLPYLPKSYWTWRTVRKPAGDYVVFSPEVRLTREDTSDDLRSFIDTLRQ